MSIEPIEPNPDVSPTRSLRSVGDFIPHGAVLLAGVGRAGRSAFLVRIRLLVKTIGSNSAWLCTMVSPALTVARVE